MNEALFNGINGMAGRWPQLDAAMVFVASYLPLVMVLPLVVLFLMGGNSRRAAVVAGVVAAIALGASFLLGHAYYQPRPFVDRTVQLLLEHKADSSFPSRHAAAAFGMALGLLPRRKRVGLVLLAAALLVGVARVYTGVHWPVDVMGSALVAGFVALGVHGFLWLADGVPWPGTPNGPSEVLYVDTADDLAAIIGRMESAPEAKVFYLVLPPGASVLRSPVEFRLLARACREMGAEAVVVTSETSRRNAAYSAGIPIRSSLESLPQLPA